jgi:Cupin-like domain
MSSVLMNQETMPAPATGADPEPRLLQLDPQTFRACFDRRPFMIGHHLAGHPLFELSRLIRLSQSLPEASVEYNAGDIPVNLTPDRTPRNGLSAGETIRRIAECKSWLVLKYVEHDPDYRALLHQCLAQVARHSEPVRPGMCLAQAFVFITSPASVTPYHMDPEHNFLLQIRGSKRIRLFDGRDRSIVSEEELERHYGGAHRNLVYRDELETRGWTFDLTPGFGLHFPVTAPHYVKNGSEVSVSFSITFRTPDIERRSETHNFNAVLRRSGLRPAPVGKHPWRDCLKGFNIRVGRKLHRLLVGRMD